MKKIINKNSLLAFLVGGILFSGINVCADYLYKSQQISYNELNVKRALDELYTKTSIISNGDATANDIALGKIAVVNGELVTGTKIVTSGLSDGTYYITVGVNAAYQNVSSWSLSCSRSANYVIKLVIENGVPTVSWHSAPYTGNADLWITAGGVSISK